MYQNLTTIFISLCVLGALCGIFFFSENQLYICRETFTNPTFYAKQTQSNPISERMLERIGETRFELASSTVNKGLTLKNTLLKLGIKLYITIYNKAT